jgi:5-methylcytosine-specific restriction endonuclease McrA
MKSKFKIATVGSRIATVNTFTAPPPPHRAHPNYNSQEWKRLSKEVVKERGARCEECGRTGCRLSVDHIVETKDGGEWFEKGNLRVLCGSCHVSKSNRARERRTGYYRPQ